MDTLPLPFRPNLQQYKKRAKDLVKAAQPGNADAVRTWGAEWLETLVRLTETDAGSFVYRSFERAIGNIEKGVEAKVKQAGASGVGLLPDAQFLIARAHGFENWAAFATQVDRASREEADAFEPAADAVVEGGLARLQALLHQSPALIHARSPRTHRAMLLHYVAANGVEDFRQKTPANAVEIARCLLEAGAEVDALANTYGGGKRQTTLNLLVSSAHPAAAGLMVPLVETLLDFGAAINGLEDDGSPLMTALSFGYPDAAEALDRRGARVDNLVAAAALGRVDLVDRLFRDATQKEQALVWACQSGRTEVVEFLLERGVDAGSVDIDRMTGLHQASANGHLDVVRLLLDRDAPLEVKNRWGGTVLDSTVFFARNQPMRGVDYAAVIKMLLEAGADVSATVYPTGKAPVDAVLQRYREAGNR